MIFTVGTIKIVNIDGNVEEFINRVHIEQIVDITPVNPVEFINETISSIGRCTECPNNYEVFKGFDLFPNFASKNANCNLLNDTINTLAYSK